MVVVCHIYSVRDKQKAPLFKALARCLFCMVCSRVYGCHCQSVSQHKIDVVFFRAWSVTWNPHKMMGVPLQCSVILVKKRVRNNPFLSSLNVHYNIHEYFRRVLPECWMILCQYTMNPQGPQCQSVAWLVQHSNFHNNRLKYIQIYMVPRG